jgi:lysophospholipase L1-like esterase
MKLLRWALALAFVGMLAQEAVARPPAADATRTSGRWVASWASSQQLPEPRNALPPGDLDDATLRQIVRMTQGGDRIRVRLSNAFGTAPLRVTAVHVARAAARGSAGIEQGSDRALTFGGSPGVTIPAGADYLSDPVSFDVAPLSRLAVTLHLAHAPEQQTSHPGSRTTSFLVHGAQLSAADLPGAKTFEHWFELAAVEVAAGPRSSAIVVLGDSITDGHGATDNLDDRWPDRLADRLQASAEGRRFSVLNHGIGGNRLLLDGLGPNALARFDRDVLAQAGVSHLIVLEGVNDLGTLTRDAPASPDQHAALVQQMIGAYQQIAMRARARGIRVIGATILPYGSSGYYHPTLLNEADRQAVNRWIRTPGAFDAVIDFDAVTRDPAHPERMLPAYDSGDGLHPSPAGYRAMGDAVPLSLFTH